jgi:Domain of unknown function (DUF4365)
MTFAGTFGGSHVSREAVLDHNNHQGLYGEYFVRFLAAAAGYGSMKPDPDRGIDLFIIDHHSLPVAVAQVKSWRVPRSTGRTWRYPNLTEKQYNVIAGNLAVPAYLFIVVVPREPQHYTQAGEQQLLARRAAYWVSLAGRPKIQNPSDSRVQVDVPCDNLLTVDSLASLCEGRFTIYSHDGLRPSVAETP